jgi:hypothetical protein
MPIPDAFDRLLMAFEWLREEHPPRPDPVGETWRMARAQYQGTSL